jgi:thymidylate synthase
VIEAAWVLCGRRDLEPLAFAVKRYNEFSDDNQTLNGAYGFRLRSYFGHDQLLEAIKFLKKDRSSRRIFMSLGAVEDIGSTSRDVPCNISVMLLIRHGRLDITVINRSNDLYLGVPYNIFIFYVLQRFIAAELDCDIGVQRHYSNCLHVYERDLDKLVCIVERNSTLQIADYELKFQQCDIVPHLIDSREAIVDLRFEHIRNASLRKFMAGFDALKRRNDLKTFEASLHDGVLGHLGRQWARQRRGLSLAEVRL